MEPPNRQTILLLAANPYGTDKIRWEDEIKTLRDALRKTNFELQAVPQAEITALQKEFSSLRPRIVHFSGHGETEGLIFNDEQGEACLAPPAALADLFRLFKNSVHCVVLNACWTQAQAEAIHQHIPVVIGMNQAVTDQAALAFSAGFYNALGDGRSCREAFEFGRNRIHLQSDDGQHNVPVLLCRDLSPRTYTNPYRGLAAFRENDTEVFFGREREITALLRWVKIGFGNDKGFPKTPPDADAFRESAPHSQNNPRDEISSSRFLALVGVSGSGKSSVVFAGLAPRLDETWQMIQCRPENNPFNRLALAFVRLLYPDKLEQAARLSELEEHLREGKVTLPALLQIWNAEPEKNADPHCSKLLLIIDQFEELYTNSEEDTQHAYLNCLLALIKSDVPAALLLTLRADFVNQALAYPDFAAALNGHTRFISTMNREELREVIELPAQQAGLTLESALSTTILDDVGPGSGRLPLLQFALTELCERQQQGQLTHAAYQAAGGVEQALARYAEDQFKQFPPAQHPLLRRIFVQLVHPGQGTEDTRRVAPRSQLAEHWGLIKELADRRLIVTGRDETSRQETAEVVHEALLHHWQRLRQWMKEDRTFRVWQDEVRHDRQFWLEHGCQEADLLHGARLSQAEDMLNKRREDLKIEADFIEAGSAARDKRKQEAEERRLRELQQARALAAEKEQRIEEQQQANRRLKNRFALAAVISLFAVIAGILAFWQWGEAEEQKVKAEQQTAVAKEQKALAEQKKTEAQDARLLAEQNEQNAKQARKKALRTQSLFLADLAQQQSKQGKTATAMRLALEALPGQGEADSDRESVLQARQALYDAILKHWQGGLEYDSSVMAIQYNPDGTLLAIPMGDQVYLYDTHTMILHYTLKGHTGTVRSVAFSPDGKTLATGSWDNSVRLWDTAGGRELRTLKGHADGVVSVTFSPDGKTLATGSSDKSVRLWDTTDGRELRALKGHTGTVKSVAFSPDGKTLATGSEDNSARLWDTASGRELRSLKGHWVTVWSVAFSPDGNTLATSSSDYVRLWDTTSWRELRTLKGHAGMVISIAFSPDGKTLATGSWHNSV
ncbi:MAG: CHAT domain-containing protein [Gammaproteobacteria bacterium]|nr:CHAT domain-containing protein [Gammaproteobacteria bacterium]